MYIGKLVFAQAMDHLPLHSLRRCIQRYDGNRHVKRFSCQDQYRCMAFAQLTYRESLRDIQACLNAQSNKLYHMGIVRPNAAPQFAQSDNVTTNEYPSQYPRVKTFGLSRPTYTQHC
jgi:hypothetical protein